LKAGKEYELLVEKLYKDLEPNAIITHDDHIYDAQARIKRQIDVSIKYKFAGVNHLIIVEVKDYKHKADISVVDKFQQVIEDVNANKGILICSKGFSKTALTKAKNYGIECLTIYSALNKKWETILKIPVKKIVHQFSLKDDILLNIAHKAGKKVKMLPDTFSYDGINIINSSDIIIDHIINKMGWNYIKKQKKIKLDLKQLNIYHSFDDEMLLIEKGYLEICYLKSSVKKFYVEPTNYIYEFDQINDTNKLHNLTISQQTLDNILHQNENNKDIIESAIITTTIFKFNENSYNMSFNFNFKGGIEGEFFIKGNKILEINDRNKSIVELENILKSKTPTANTV
jgi:ribosomal protein L18E